MTNNPSLEERICIAGNYEAEKIALIRELMEEEAKGMLRYVESEGLNLERWSPDINETYIMYKQTK